MHSSTKSGMSRKSEETKTETMFSGSVCVCVWGGGGGGSGPDHSMCGHTDSLRGGLDCTCDNLFPKGSW